MHVVVVAPSVYKDSFIKILFFQVMFRNWSGFFLNYNEHAIVTCKKYPQNFYIRITSLYKQIKCINKWSND